MKLIITSLDALIDNKTSEFYPNVFDSLDEFLAKDKENSVAVVSIHRDRLKVIDKKYHPIVLSPKLRGSGALIESIVNHIGIEYSDIVFLGAKDRDVYTASNAKILLLRAEYAKSNNPEDRLFTKPYGIAINSPSDIPKFFDRYSAILSPWYYRLEVDINTTLYALTDANTFDKEGEEKILNEKFKDCLKKGNAEYRDPFTVYFLVSIYQIFREVNSVDYWEVYPTSDGAANDDLEFFARKAREALNGRDKEPLFIRTKAADKRHYKKGDERIALGCSNQFDTMIINPYYDGKLKDKTVCIIDDFTTYGTSCETARHLLQAAGVKKIIFITMGKFGKNYYKYNYKITGDVFSSFKYSKPSIEKLTGDFNASANKEFLLTFKEL